MELRKVLMALFVYLFFLVHGCSSSQNTGNITKKLADKLTDTLGFAGGEKRTGEKPQGHPDDNAYPQITGIMMPEELVPGPFQITITSYVYNGPAANIGGVVLHVGESGEYWFVKLNLQNTGTPVTIYGIFRGGEDQVVGRKFKFEVAMVLTTGEAGNYATGNVTPKAGPIYDGGMDIGEDTGVQDSGVLDSGEDAGADATQDTYFPIDASQDTISPVDASQDAGPDGGPDASMDGGSPDSGDLPVGDFGYFLSLVVLPNSEAYAAAYNKTYGDLVAFKFTFDDPTMLEKAVADPKSIEFIDGVPTGGLVTGNLNGPRGGIAGPGPNVGTDVSLAVMDGAGNLGVAYFDATNSALKYAGRNDGVWGGIHFVDGGEGWGGKAGRFASLVSDASGIPHIAYMQEYGPPGAGGSFSALKIAVAKSSHPTAKSDWTITVVDSGAVSCLQKGVCPVDESCVALRPLGECRKEVSGCSPSCGPPSEILCVEGYNLKPVCVTVMNSGLNGLPEGIGLFASAAVGSDGNVYISYYDNLPDATDIKKSNSRLKGARYSSGGVSSTWVIDNGDDIEGNKTSNVGLYSSLTATSEEIRVAYFDATAKVLKYWHGAFATKGAIERVTTSVSRGVRDSKGADCSLTNDGPAVVFQNSTTTELFLAKRGDDGNPWPVSNIVMLLDPMDPGQTARFGKGGYGFFTKNVLHGGFTYIATMKMGTKNPESPEVDNRVILIKRDQTFKAAGGK